MRSISYVCRRLRYVHRGAAGVPLHTNLPELVRKLRSLPLRQRGMPHLEEGDADTAAVRHLVPPLAGVRWGGCENCGAS